ISRPSEHEESIINFIAAYGTHSAITDETTILGKRAAALAIVTGTSVEVDDDGDGIADRTIDRRRIASTS
ncbi:MAG: hypothetical protein HC850_06160, partial [Rhodomicrobium sp.]|nr:hypothetical protein [Rhodomicrobium sp.]